MFGANLIYFAFQHTPKSLQKPTPRGTKILIDFYFVFFLVFGSVLGAKSGPRWLHFRTKWGDPVGCSPLFCWVYVIFRFFGRLGAILAPFWLHFGASGPNLASILEVFGSILAPCWRYVGPLGRKKLALEGLVGLREAQRIGIPSRAPPASLPRIMV